MIGDVAMVDYRFAIRYDLGGLLHDEQGRELLTFLRKPEGWRAIWRTQLPA